MLGALLSASVTLAVLDGFAPEMVFHTLVPIALIAEEMARRSTTVIAQQAWTWTQYGTAGLALCLLAYIVFS